MPRLRPSDWAGCAAQQRSNHGTYDTCTQSADRIRALRRRLTPVCQRSAPCALGGRIPGALRHDSRQNAENVLVAPKAEQVKIREVSSTVPDVAASLSAAAAAQRPASCSSSSWRTVFWFSAVRASRRATKRCRWSRHLQYGQRGSLKVLLNLFGTAV